MQRAPFNMFLLFGGGRSLFRLDVLLFDLEGNFLAKAITDRGEEFLKRMKEGSPVDEFVFKDAESLSASASDKISVSVSKDKLREKGVNELFGAPFWEEVAFSCINCGTCTYLCPTCWCFDIQDEVLGLLHVSAFYPPRLRP